MVNELHFYNLNSNLQTNVIVNSNGGGITYWTKIDKIVYVTINAEKLIYMWNAGTGILNSPLPKPLYRISFSIQKYSDGSFIPCYLNNDGYIILGNTGIDATDLPLSAAFSYFTEN